MFYTIDALMKGDKEILKYYFSAHQIWSETLKIYPIEVDSSIGKLAQILLVKQGAFETNCGGRSIGKEIMAISGVVYFYDLNTGYDIEWGKPNENKRKKARNLFNAILLSGCSIEVKGIAKKIAKYYGLIES